jgi:hypothetical protein
LHLHPNLLFAGVLGLVALCASGPAQAARCGGLNQQACKANEASRACTGRLVNSGGRCQIRKTVPRTVQPRKVEPHVQIEKPPAIQPQLCNPSALTTKGGRC